MRGKAGNGVDLIKKNLSFSCEKEIHAGKAAAAQGAVYLFGGLRCSRLLFFRDAGRAMDL